jgi:hypothetical protein
MSMANKGMVSGDQEVPLKQRPLTDELLVQLTNAGEEINPQTPDPSILANSKRVEQLLSLMLIEMRKLNTQLSLITDNIVEEQDVITD